jgi:DNA-binding MarR family transcriptional regulator
MMRTAVEWMREQIFAGVLAEGYDDVNPAHVSLFRWPGMDRMRPTDLADQMRITKQSVNDLLGHLEQRGYLVREPDPNDGRARIVRLTPAGRRLDQVVNREAKAAEERIAETLGPKRFAELRQALEILHAELSRQRNEAS